MRFEDVSPAELEFEHLADSSPVPLPEPPITSTGALCVEASLAEPEVDPAIDGVGFMPLRALLRRRAHPLDRRAACRAVGAAV